MFQAVSPSPSSSQLAQQTDIQQLSIIQALQLQQLQQIQSNQQQQFPLGGFSPAVTSPHTLPTPQQPAFPAFQNCEMTSTAQQATSNVKVVIDRRNTFSLGFTPFKFSIADCKAGRIPFDFGTLMDQVRFAETSGGLPVQAVELNGIAARSGLRAWDVIIGVNNVDVRGYGGQQTIDTIKQLPPGTALELVVLRSSNPPAPVIVQKIPSFAEILCCGGGD